MAFNGKSYHIVNVIAYSLLLIICLNGFSNVFHGNISYTNVLRCLVVLPFCVDRDLSIVHLPTLSPDLIVTIFIFYVIILSVNYLEQRAELYEEQALPQQDGYILILCISLFLPTINWICEHLNFTAFSYQQCGPGRLSFLSLSST